jgi:hypothetical protein
MLSFLAGAGSKVGSVANGVLVSMGGSSDAVRDAGDASASEELVLDLNLEAADSDDKEACTNAGNSRHTSALSKFVHAI